MPIALPSGPVTTDRLYNGVRLVDRPCPANIRRIDQGAYPLINRMHLTGMRVDVPRLRALSLKLTDLMHDETTTIRQLVGRDINPASPLQVGKLLFDELQIQGDEPVPQTDSGADSTNADVLELFKDAHPVVSHILQWREYQKLQGTYADKMPRMVDGESRIHTRFKTTRTSTGRLASEDPNLQNIPSRSELGVEVRNAFTASPGWVLLSQDLSQIEMRIAAHASGEPVMVTGYGDPEWDMHTQTAMDIFGLAREQVDKKRHRLPAKTVGFGVLYLIGDQGLQKQIVSAGGDKWPLAQCEDLLNRFYANRPSIAAWQAQQFHRARRYGMVWTEFGRFRVIPQMRSALTWIQSAGMREGANQPIQGFAQDILKLGMAYIWDRLMEYDPTGAKVRPLLQIHDELIYECASRAIAEEWSEIARYGMEQLVPLRVPILSSKDVAERWGELK